MGFTSDFDGVGQWDIRGRSNSKLQSGVCHSFLVYYGFESERDRERGKVRGGVDSVRRSESLYFLGACFKLYSAPG